MSSPHQHNPKDPACLEIFARLSEYIDGELPPPDCRDVESHIADCAPCIEFLESLKRSIGATHHFEGSSAPQPVPPEVEEKLKRAWQAALARRTG